MRFEGSYRVVFDDVKIVGINSKDRRCAECNQAIVEADEVVIIGTSTYEATDSVSVNALSFIHLRKNGKDTSCFESYAGRLSSNQPPAHEPSPSA